MKRTARVISTLSLALVMTSTISPAMVSADGGTVVPVLISAEGDGLAPEKISYEANKEELDFIRVEGTIKEVRSHEGKLSILVQNGAEEGSSEMVFNISDELLIINQSSKDSFDKKGLKEGLKIEAFYRKDVPMIMIYPPQISPDLLVINSEEKVGSMEHSKFNDELVNTDNSLKLNISDETSIINQYGEKLTKEELGNKELIVFYTITTRSIPAQTSPEKVIVLENELSKDISSTGEYVNEKHNIMFRIPPVWESNYKIVETEDDASAIKLQVDFRFEPEGHFLELKQNIVSIYAIEKDKFENEFAKDGYIEVFNNEKYVYAAKIHQNYLYTQGELGDIYNKMIEPMDGINDLFTTNIESEDDAMMKEIAQIINADSYYKNGVQMVPLRKIAEYMGYEIEWKNDTRSIILTKGNSSFLISIGKPEYGYNKSLKRFATAPEIKNNNTYVPNSLLELLK